MSNYLSLSGSAWNMNPSAAAANAAESGGTAFGAPAASSGTPSYNDILSVYQQSYPTQALKDIQTQYAGINSQQQQNLYSRGLSQTSLSQNAQLGVQKAQDAAQQRLQENYANGLAGLMERGAGGQNFYSTRGQQQGGYSQQQQSMTPLTAGFSGSYNGIGGAAAGGPGVGMSGGADNMSSGLSGKPYIPTYAPSTPAAQQAAGNGWLSAALGAWGM